MIKQSSIFLVVCFFSTALSIKPNFYWRDYDGTIPSDAIIGGNLNGGITYIGLISAMPGQGDRTDMITALIIPGNLTAYAAYLGRLKANDQAVKILCTTEPCRFVWTKQLGANCVHIRGSYPTIAQAFYIGRASYEGNLVTGRVNLVENRLYMPMLSPPFTQVYVSDFETLTYC